MGHCDKSFHIYGFHFQIPNGQACSNTKKKKKPISYLFTGKLEELIFFRILRIQNHVELIRISFPDQLLISGI